MTDTVVTIKYLLQNGWLVGPISADNLIDAIPKGKQLDYTQPLVQGVMYINQLFEKEDEIRQKYKTFDAIKETRIAHEKPIIEGFLSWLKKQIPARNSRLDKAVTYIWNRKEHLMTYLEDGRCSFSNNLRRILSVHL